MSSRQEYHMDATPGEDVSFNINCMVFPPINHDHVLFQIGKVVFGAANTLSSVDLFLDH